MNKAKMTPASENLDRYQLLVRVIDDADIHKVFGRFPRLENRVRKDHQRYFRAWLRQYEHEVWVLNRTRIQTFAADGKWLESGRAILRAGNYGRLCFRLRCAAVFWRWGVVSPGRLVRSSVAELRKLDGYDGFLDSSITPLPSA